ncbi:hypothetical protein WBG78_16295 [Chryseolinea sp. T2]|uniref:hypothetical protein n=1 Tax=Chryseolinea sp. T2 TaxID=3129255 RepID=UPI003077C16D
MLEKIVTLTIACAVLSLCCVGQDARIKQIEATVGLINNNNSLVLNELDANELYNQSFDGGGTCHHGVGWSQDSNFIDLKRKNSAAFATEFPFIN